MRDENDDPADLARFQELMSNLRRSIPYSNVISITKPRASWIDKHNAHLRLTRFIKEQSPDVAYVADGLYKVYKRILSQAQGNVARYHVHLFDETWLKKEIFNSPDEAAQHILTRFDANTFVMPVEYNPAETSRKKKAARVAQEKINGAKEPKPLASAPIPEPEMEEAANSPESNAIHAYLTSISTWVQTINAIVFARSEQEAKALFAQAYQASNFIPFIDATTKIDVDLLASDINPTIGWASGKLTDFGKGMLAELGKIKQQS